MIGVTSMGDMNEILNISVEEPENQGYIDAMAKLNPEVNGHGIIVNYPSCTTCGKVNVMEYANDVGRVLAPEVATRGWCLHCGARYEQVDGEWLKMGAAV